MVKTKSQEDFMVTKEQILDALRKVIDPEIGKDIVDMGMVHNVDIGDGQVVVDIHLTIKGCPLQNKIRDDVIAAISALPGVNSVKVNIGEMTNDEKQALSKRFGQKREVLFENTHVIAVGSGKGGVGKSTITANLALALHKLGYKVGLIDTDILGYSIPSLLGTKGKQATAIDEHTIMPIEAHGIKTISMGNFMSEEDVALIWRGPILGGILEQFFSDVYWGDLDYLVLDLPPGTGDVPLSVLQRIPTSKLLLVTTPQSSAAHVAGRLGNMAEKVKVDILGIIENMSYFICPNCSAKHYIFGQGETEAITKILNTEILGQIPLDIEIRQDSDNGIPTVLKEGDNSAKIYMDIAERITEKLPVSCHTNE
jgi:ATP-binding protein involved in chromosome partitioning